MHSKHTVRMNEDQGKDIGLDGEPSEVLGLAKVFYLSGLFIRTVFQVMINISPSCKSLKLQNHLQAFQLAHPWHAREE